jgi:hypothetical protein
MWLWTTSTALNEWFYIYIGCQEINQTGGIMKIVDHKKGNIYCEMWRADGTVQLSLVTLLLLTDWWALIKLTTLINLWCG